MRYRTGYLRLQCMSRLLALKSRADPDPPSPVTEALRKSRAGAGLC
jgi:hypothetical protein